ncbi:metallophosphoesterase family protein [Streptomyces sp. H27-D2]|uniref:metallophosphoesterase family protein n=1 Tax=Streptomyces sp. H27-D2 TaxID=3046304 RepID=UPI002DBEE198|nr:exonuclease SbcCD subunit D [Streptomyces sp. H27-D2]MEC4020348.1 exonuclease SbcCD subunit D [Streptomyces sp. H27-D2]
MSRLLHTSDWHLGHTLYGHPREEDFDAVLAEIVAIAQESRPDLIVHSGDLFHSSRPTVRDLMRAMHSLGELAAVAPTVVVAGNHDSPAYFEFLNYMSGPAWGRGLSFIHRLRPGHDGGILTFDACGGEQRIRLAAIPFVHPNRFWQRSAPGTSYADYAEGMREVQAELVEALHEGYDPGRDILLFAAHVLIAGARSSPSERVVDEAFETGPGDIPVVSYAALGHIHRPQTVEGLKFTARYAGSPLPMDFGEAGESKSVVIVDADPGRPVRALPRRLTSGRRLANFTGTLDELKAAADQYDGTFLKPVITGEEPDVLLGQRIAEIVPGAILINPAPAREAVDGAVLDSDVDDEPDLPDAFRAYLAQEGLSSAAAESTVTAFIHLLNELDDETPPPVPAEELLRTALDDTWTEAP